MTIGNKRVIHSDSRLVNPGAARSVMAKALILREIETFRAFQSLLMSFDANDIVGFAAIIKYVASLGFSFDQIALRFGVSPGSVSRWASGFSRPIKPARESVILGVRAWVDDQLICREQFCVANGIERPSMKVISLDSRRPAQGAKPTSGVSSKADVDKEATRKLRRNSRD